MRDAEGRGRIPLFAGRRDLGAACLFLLPALLAVLTMRLWPSGLAVVSALNTSDTGFRPGFGNFAYLFTDPEFLGALGTTLLFSVLVNPIQIAMALGLALLLNRSLPGGGLWRTLLLLPAAVPQSVSAVIWGVAMRPDGPLNGALLALHLPAQPFLTSPLQALPAIIVIASWVGVGYWMTFLIAGLKDIPTSFYEAAAIDGASAWQCFRHITLPGLRRPLTFVLVADTVANVLLFAPVQILTKGGPQGSTNLVMNDIYSRAFVADDPSGAAAATVVLVAVVLVVVGVQFRLMLERDAR